MSPPTASNDSDNDPFAFLNALRDPAGPSTSSRPVLPNFDDSDDEDANYGHDFDVHEEIPGESPNTSQSTTPGQSQQNVEDPGGEDEEFEGEGRRRHRGEEVEEEDGEDGGHEYELRRNINRETFKGSGYTDHDKTGDYNPEEESDEELAMERVGRGRKRLSDHRRKRDRKGKGKARQRSASRVGEDEDGEDDDARNADNGLDDDVSAMDGLHLNDPSQSQDAEDDEDDDDDVSVDDVATNTSDIDPDELRLRKMIKKKMPRRPAGPPQPQSCLACRELKLDCSLHYEPASYPCHHCQDSKCGCILRRPYTADQKSGNKKAISKRKVADRKARAIKMQKDKQLLREQKKKIADLKRRHEKEKRNKACTECRGEGKKCSNEDKEWTDIRGQVCKRCFKHGRICELPSARAEPEDEEEERRLPRGQRPLPTFGSPAFDRNDDEEVIDAIHNVAPDGEAPKKRGPRKSKKKASKLSEEMALDESPGEAYVCAPGYAKKQITTSFCHPLIFNAPMQADDEECMGCDLHTTAFTIFGFPVAEPWVIYPDPCPSLSPIHQAFQYTEIPGTGGHSESTDHSKTNVCKACTFARQKILFCPGHQLAGIRNLPKPKDFDFDAAYAPLLSDQDMGYRTNTAANTKWCSVCPAPAFLECVSEGLGSQGMAFGGREGCGLVLCEICAVSCLVPKAGNPVQRTEMDGLAGREVQALLRDVKKVNIAARAAVFNPGQQVRERSSIPVRRQLEDVIEEAKRMCESAGGKGGNYMDGVRADVELISKRGWLWEWMECEAERQRQVQWAGSGIASGSGGRQRR